MKCKIEDPRLKKVCKNCTWVFIDKLLTPDARINVFEVICKRYADPENECEILQGDFSVCGEIMKAQCCFNCNNGVNYTDYTVCKKRNFAIVNHSDYCKCFEWSK